MQSKIQILPSLLAGDFGNLEASAKKAEASGGDALHLDIMDGHFVPNISMGPDVVRMAHRCVRIPLNVHLMLSNPDQYLKTFIEAGAQTLTIHIEASCDVPAALREIRKRGARPGISLNPDTPVSSVIPVLNAVDEVLFMSVHPGFGGQSFIRDVPRKARELCRRIKSFPELAERSINLAIDGGIDLETVVEAASAGINVIIAGSSLYRAADMARDITEMRARAEKAFGRGLLD